MREPGAEIELERVHYTAEVEPLNVEFWLRTLDDDDVIVTDGDIDNPYSHFASASGRPPRYRGEDAPYAGEHTQDIAGTRISQLCSEFEGKNRSLGFTVLVLAMKVGTKGARIPSVSIHYRGNGKPYTLTTEWRMSACGTALVERNCSARR